MSYERLRPTFTFDVERLEQLKAVAPEAFADGAINWEILRAAVGDYAEDESSDVEHFGLFWPGKRAARRRASESSLGTLMSMPGQGVNETATHNIFIEADNLDALQLLRKAYAGRVKMIYVDPPYNTGNDFVYRDDFEEREDEYLRRTGQMSDQGQFLTTNTKADGRFHSNWLSMMYSRLLLARNLLKVDGVILVSIDDNEVHHLRMLLSEIFGEENFIAQLIWKSRQFPDSRSSTQVSTDHEYILVYTNQNEFSFRGVGRDESKFSNPDNDQRGDWMSRSILGLATAEQRPNLHFPIIDPMTQNSFSPPANTGWRYSPERMKQLIAEGKILFPPKETGRPREKKFRVDLLNEFISFPSIIDDVFTAQGTAEIREVFGFQAFDFPKPTELIRRLVEQGTDKDDIIFDLFAGSGTTASAVFKQNIKDGGSRRFVCIQLPEASLPKSELRNRGFINIAELAKIRIRREIEKTVKEQKQQLLVTETDLGFKVFKFDISNFKYWEDYEGDNTDQVQMLFDQFEIPLIDGWQPSNLLIEVMLLQGFPLDSRVASLSQFASNTVQGVTSDFHDHSLYTCFDETITDETINMLMLNGDDVFVCLDSALTDESKARLADVCNLRTI